MKHFIRCQKTYLVDGLPNDERTAPVCYSSPDEPNFCAIVVCNINNEALSDAEFRAFIRRILPVVQFSGQPIAQQQDEYKQLKQERFDELARKLPNLTDDELKEFEALS